MASWPLNQWSDAVPTITLMFPGTNVCISFAPSLSPPAHQPTYLPTYLPAGGLGCMGSRKYKKGGGKADGWLE